MWKWFRHAYGVSAGRSVGPSQLGAAATRTTAARRGMGYSTVYHGGAAIPGRRPKEKAGRNAEQGCKLNVPRCCTLSSDLAKNAVGWGACQGRSPIVQSPERGTVRRTVDTQLPRYCRPPPAITNHIQSGPTMERLVRGVLTLTDNTPCCNPTSPGRSLETKDGWMGMLW